ncbi:MAG: hypothetical protein IKA99_04285 [Clostridia bacterium]|nr:hypothetical protein [Clostridia bacterium]
MAFKGVTVLDIGSYAISVLAGERGVNNTFSVKGQAVKHYEGFAEGKFFDEHDLETAIGEALNEIADVIGGVSPEIYVSVPGVFVDLENKKYKISLGKPRKIRQKDVDCLLNEGKLKVESEGFEVIGCSEIYFALDDNRRVVNPVGVVSSLLGGAITYYSCDKKFTSLLRRILLKHKIKDVKFVFVGQAEGEYLLKREEREFPSLIIDVGYITSELTLHLGNGILAECCEDFGGGYLTFYMLRDFGLSVKDAESLKREINFAHSLSSNSVYTIFTDDGEVQFPCETVNEIALDAVDSFVGLISDFIEENASPFAENLRIYLTGGGLSYLRGVKSHLSARLGLPVEILAPKVPMHNKPDESSTFAMLNFALKDKENR